ncbi:MAG: DUF7144 family membrane protein [Actinomycetes bacterium]
MSDVKPAPTTTAGVPQQRTSRRSAAEPTGWAVWILFAGVMMIMLGFFQMIAGIVALADDSYFVVKSGDLLVSTSYTTWGWAHLIVGAVVAAAGFGVMVGQMWARVVGIVAALVSSLVNLAFLAAYPVWMTLMISFDVIVIYALTVHGRELKDIT